MLCKTSPAGGLRPARAVLACLATVLALAGFPGCAATTGARTPDRSLGDAPFPQQPGLTYVLDVRPPEGGARIDVCVTLATPGTALPSPLRFAFPPQWGGRTGFGDDIHDIAAHDELLAPLRVLRDGAAASIHHPDLDRIRVCYRVQPRHRLASEASRFRAILGADRLFAPGHAILAVPLAVSPTLTHQVLVVSQAHPDDPWALRSSLPLDGTPHRLRQWSEASFFAGPFSHASAGPDDQITHVHVDPQLALDPALLAAQIAAVVNSQRGLLGLHLARETHVVVLRRDDDPSAMTGNGREGGFVLELGDDVDVGTPELTELIAHENLHRLIGHSLVFADSEELATLWFREGLTDYLAVRTAVAAGLLPPHRLFLRIGSALTHYRGNPAAAADGRDVSAEAYWESRDLRRLPYDKGTLLALLIDLTLRESGAGDLEGWVAFLRDDASARMLPLTNAALRDALERYSRRTWTPFWSDFVAGSVTLPVHDALRRAGIDVVERLQPAPWYGLRAGSTTEGRWFVDSVAPGSPAEQAGLRAGQALAGEPWIPSDPGAGSARLLLGVDHRTAQTVVIPPAAGQRRTYVLRALDDDEGYLARFGLSPASAP